jgi:mannose-1-phosphate guanylyltransferase
MRWAVLLAGGSGTRFWPLSTPETPKQLLPLSGAGSTAEESVERLIGLIPRERVLVVAGERKRPQVPGRVYQQMEIEYGTFQRQVRLAEDVDPSAARAEYERGILRIALPVAVSPPARGRVAITVQLT